jgi:hypothetical protein
MGKTLSDADMRRYGREGRQLAAHAEAVTRFRAQNAEEIVARETAQ